MKVVAVLPAYNEARTIGPIVKCALKYVDSVIVVDNKSVNGTAVEAGKAGAIVYPEPKRGAGAATRLGWNDATWDNYYDVMVTLDGDGQHLPDEIPLLVKAIQEGADVVVGSRFLGEHNLPRYRKLGIDIINWLYNVGHRQRLADTQSCFRAYSKLVLDVVDIREDGFGFSTEVLLKVRKWGFRIAEVPISCIYHDKFARNSTLNPVRHGLSVAWATIKWRIRLKT